MTRAMVCLLLLLLPHRGLAEERASWLRPRVSATGYLDGLAVAELGGPRQRPQLVTALRLESTFSRAVRAAVGLRGRAGGPFVGGHPGVMNFVHEFQNRTPSLEMNEAYLDLRWGDLDGRIGVQKFAWGKLDGVPPSDVLNPRDLHDPLVRDVEESKIGIPAVLARYYLPPLEALRTSEVRAEAVWIPLAVPPRVALAAERWFPSSVNVTRGVTLGPARVERLFGIERQVRVPITFRTLNQRPPAELDAGGWAFRLGATSWGTDWDVAHYTGPETAPDARLLVDVELESPLDAPSLRVPATVNLQQAHDLIHMTSIDWSAALGGLTLRAEAAGFVDRPYLRITQDLFAPAALAAIPRPQRARILRRLLMERAARVPLGELFVDRDTVEWGVGADYLIRGFLPLVQLTQVVFVDGGPEQLLADPETRVLASLRKRLWQDTLELEARGLYAIEPGAWLLYPRATYRLTDRVRLRFGYLAIAGPLFTYLGQFHRNDQFVLEARYTF
jgi:hypothetical protein